MPKKKRDQWREGVKRASEAAAAAGEPEPAQPPEPVPECRFHFPKKLRSEPELIVREGRKAWVFEPERNDTHLNQYNPLVSLCWLANTDFSPCCDPQAVANYAGKYCTKAEEKSATYAEISRMVLPHVSDRNPVLSFVSKVINKLIGERDYSAQEICHVLLGLPIQEDSRVVITVDCRPKEFQGRSIDVGAEELEENRSSYDKYLRRPRHMEDLTYVEMLRNWNTRPGDEQRWQPFQGPKAKPRILMYFPRYKRKRTHPQYADFCRVKLMLNHVHRDADKLLELGGNVFRTAIEAYDYCLQHHEHAATDGYGKPEAEEVQAEDDQFEAGNAADELTVEDWQEVARMVPDLKPSQEDAELLSRRDIDVNYN